MLIFAGAGSGKTRVLTFRIAYMVQELGIPAQHILAVTFTNKAAGEMKERIEQLIGEQAPNLWAGTFHSFCARMLRADGQAIDIAPNFVIYDEADQRALIKETLSALNIDSEQYSPVDIHYEISNAKNELMTPADYKPHRNKPLERMAKRVYRRYQQRLADSNALDFDDLLMSAVGLLRESEEVREKYQDRFRYILVDEFQDINYAQFRLLQLIANKHRNLCVVGDDDQSIYGWRGANVRLILAFKEYYPQAKVFKLERNYRSTANILRCAYEVIKHNPARAEKKLWTDNPPGEPPVVYRAVNEQEEAEWVIRMIQSQVHAGDAAPGDFAVLYRTNAMSRAFEEALLDANIPYEIVGGVRFYERAEIKDVVAYLKVLLNSMDPVSLRRIINNPPRGIGKKTLQVLDREAQRQGIPLFEVCGLVEELEQIRSREQAAVADFYDMMRALQNRIDNLSLVESVREVVRCSGYLQRLRESGRADDAGRAENVEEFVTAAARFQKNHDDSSLVAFLEHIALISDIDQAEALGSAVSLMTLHSAKGLEFPAVFIAGMEEQVLPHHRSMNDDFELAEERRLCYVGMTRAQQRLYLTHCHRRTIFGETQPMQPSRFLKDLPDEVVQRRGELAPGAGPRLIESPQQAPEMQMSGRRLDLTKILSRATGRPAATDQAQPTEAVPSSAGEYTVGDKVSHPTFGEGRVVSIKGQGNEAVIVVGFPDKGIKKLLAQYAKLKKL